MRRFIGVSVFCAVQAVALSAQAPAPAGQVVGVGTFIHVVANLDKTMRFYGDGLGLERTGAPGPRAFSVNAVVENLYDAKGSQSRVAAFKIPGSPLGVEFVEFQGVAQTAVRRRLQDPGASLLAVPVSDVQAVLRKLKEDGAPGVGEGIVEDPDGFFIQPVPTVRAKLTLTVESLDRTLHVFHDLLGFEPEGGRDSTHDKALLKTLGFASGSYKSAFSHVPGTSFEVEFLEMAGVPRQTHDAAIHDPGSGVLRLASRDVDRLLGTLKAAGVPVASAGGAPVDVGGRHFVILRDPDHFYFQLVPAPNPAAAAK
jgi:catechol 2,3-dioxygenase-like lactoylglutathione lyase family enzyme